MRLIKLNKSSGEAANADLGDCVSIEVTQLKAKNTYGSDKGGAKRREQLAKLTGEEGAIEGNVMPDLLPDSTSSGQGKSRHINKDNPNIDDVYNRGIHLLSMREHSVKELVDKLSQKFPTSIDVEKAVNRLSLNNYVCDSRFTEAYVRHRCNKGLGPMKIRAELYKKGIANNLVDEYLDMDSQKWNESALNQYKKKFGNSEVEDYKDWARRARFLQGRGYSSKHIEYAVPEISCVEIQT